MEATPAVAPPRHEFATLTSDDLVTGEAVALDLPPANLALRVGSGLIDVGCTLAMLLAGGLLIFVATSRSSGAVQAMGSTALLIAVLLVLPTFIETLTRGRSIGKLCFGLRTVREDAGPITFQHAVVRSMVGFVEVYVMSGVPAFFSGLLSSKGKRLGDYAAGTYVARERVPLRLDLPAQMPTPLATWAASADVVALPTPLALAVRQLLGRAAGLDPAQRHRIAEDLARQVSAYVAPLPPPGTPAEAFLAAVVAERRARDARRLDREARLSERLTGHG